VFDILYRLGLWWYLHFSSLSDTPKNTTTLFGCGSMFRDGQSHRRTENLFISKV